MLKKILKIILILILGAIGGVLAQTLLLPFLAEQPLFAQFSFVKQFKEREVILNKTEEIIIQENTALTRAIERVEKVVVGVRTKTKTGKIIEGSGFVVTNDGLMVTLTDLIPAASDFSFFVEGKQLPFQILKRALKENFALIKIEGENFPTVGFADFSKLRLGERVFLVGVIFDKGVPQKIVNEGIVKSFSQDFIKTNIFEKYFLSGSPLFDINGQVLGICTVDLEGKVIVIPAPKIREFLGF